MTRLLHRLSFVLHAVFGRLEALPFCMKYVVTGNPAGRPAVGLPYSPIWPVCTKRRGHMGSHAE